MTVLYTDAFTSLANWTTSEAGGGAGTSDIVSNAFRQLTSTTAGNAQRAILGSGNWNVADGEATIKFTISSGAAAVPQVILRGSGSWDSEIDSPVTGFKLIVNQGSNVWAVYKRTGGTTTQIGSNQSFTPSVGTQYTIGFKITGTSGSITVYGKVFATGGADPGYTTVASSQTGPNGPGQCQLANLTTASVAQDVRWDDLSLDDLVVAGTAPGVKPGRRVFA